MQSKQLKMDGWTTCDFTSSLTVIHLNQDDGWVIMKDCVQWIPFTTEKDSRLQRGSNSGPLGQ